MLSGRLHRSAMREIILHNWKKLIIVFLPLIGITIAVYLTQFTQIFKPKANTEINAGLKVTSTDGGNVTYDRKDTFKTDSPNIRINITDLKNLED